MKILRKKLVFPYFDALLAWWFNGEIINYSLEVFNMILSDSEISYFKEIQSKVLQGAASLKSGKPYLVRDDPVLRNYECIRRVWHECVPIKKVCADIGISRTNYYRLECQFVDHGLPGLFPLSLSENENSELEQLVVIVKSARSSLSVQSLLRIAEAVPVTDAMASLENISQILKSFGLTKGAMPIEKDFFARIQRIMSNLQLLRERKVPGRRRKNRKATFFSDFDICHKKLELLRELALGNGEVARKLVQFGISESSYYRLRDDYSLFGPWAALPSPRYGREGESGELELTVILHKLKAPGGSALDIVNDFKLKCSRHAVDRILKKWGLLDKKRLPVCLDRYVTVEADSHGSQKTHVPAWELVDEERILETRRMNRHFEILCGKMRRHEFSVCDPGPLLLAPFVNELCPVHSLEVHGPSRLQGTEMSNPVLLNVFRIIAGYPHASHLRKNSDRSVAFAAGLGMFGSNSKFFDDTLGFKFEHIHNMRNDLLARAEELGLVKGEKIAFDFHFKEFYGTKAKEKGIGKGPNKAGDLKPGFRPHVAWDLETNTIIAMSYFHGGVRATSIMRKFCENHIFPVLSPDAVKEIYMDSEYTKEGDISFLKQVRCRNGDVYICLKRNPQINALIKPALEENTAWKNHNGDHEIKSVTVNLPRTSLPMKIIIIRDMAKKENIHCFGTTRVELNDEVVLDKYRYRWIIENGLKDLVASYFCDKMPGMDPEKIEFEFYCISVAKLAFELFLRELGGNWFQGMEGSKTTLATMRSLLLEKRNCRIRMEKDTIILTILDSCNGNLETNVLKMFERRAEENKNRVLWWNNRPLNVEFKDQYR